MGMQQKHWLSSSETTRLAPPSDKWGIAAKKSEHIKKWSLHKQEEKYVSILYAKNATPSKAKTYTSFKSKKEFLGFIFVSTVLSSFHWPFISYKFN